MSIVIMNAVNDILDGRKTVTLNNDKKLTSLTTREIAIITKRLSEQKNEKISLAKDLLWH